MNIVYLLIHKIRLEENNPPYYYIGSKWKWNGDKSYISSSRSKIVKDSDPSDFILTPIWFSESCTKEELLEKEKEFQLAHDVIKNKLFFNGNIANSKIFTPESRNKAVESFKKKAWSETEEGKLLKDVWSERATQVKKERYSKEFLSEKGKENMRKLTDSGKSVCQLVHEGMMQTMSEVGDDGLTGFQRAGKVLSTRLAEVDEASGLTFAEKLRYFGSDYTRLTKFGFTFFSKSSASKLLSVDKSTMDRIISGKCSKETYLKLCSTFGNEAVDKEDMLIISQGASVINVCGKQFGSFESLKAELGVSHWAVEQFSKTGIPNKKLRIALINYFSEEVYNIYYPKVKPS